MLILAFVLAAAVGALQVLFDVLLYAAVFAGKIARGVLSGAVKLAVYALFLWLVFKLFKLFVGAAAVGFAVGFFPLLVIYCIRKLKN